nr:hypothetical protein [Thermoanaerobaculia bacterium]
ARQTTLGRPEAEQASTFWLDADWTPRRLIAAVGETAVMANFTEEETVVVAADESGTEKGRFAIPRRDVYFALEGGLYFPLLLVQRFDFASPFTQTFRGVPGGSCQLRRLEDQVVRGERFRVLEVHFDHPNSSDTLELYVREDGELDHYIASNLDCVVQLSSHYRLSDDFQNDSLTVH